MRFVSPSIKAAFLVFFLVACGVGALGYTGKASAAGTLPAGCSLNQGIIVCADAGTGPDGTSPIPPGCSSVGGILVCGDGSTGSEGSVCITSGDEQSCLTGGGGFSVGSSRGALGSGLGKVLGTPSQTTGTGWLSRITGWLSYALNSLFSAIAQFFKDLVTYSLAVVLGVFALAVTSIPVPDWIAGNSLGSMLGQTGAVVGFFMVQLQIPAALGLIGAGYAFRLIRKFATLFQW